MQNYQSEKINFCRRTFRTPRYYLIALAISLTPFAGSGCGSIRIGKDFSGPGVTEGIKIGETQMETVMAVVGQPKARGKGYLPPQGPVDVWVYAFAVATIGDTDSVKEKQLLIFFDKDRKVQSYIWWSSF